mgnify:CR=1 FL=1
MKLKRRKYTKKSRKTIKRKYTKKSRKTIKRRYTNKRYTGGTGEDPYQSAVDEEESELNEAQRAAETMAKQTTGTPTGHQTAWLNHDIVCSGYDKVSCDEDPRCYYVDYGSATGAPVGCKNKYSFNEWRDMDKVLPRPPPTTSVKPSAVKPSAVTQDHSKISQEYASLQQEIKDLRAELDLAN